MSGRWSKTLPYVFMLVAALSRWPGLFPVNFSAFYALAFCAGAFFPKEIKWSLPVGKMVGSDLALNLYYYFAMGINAFQPMQLVNYACFAGLIWFGTKFNSRTSFTWLLGGGIVGAILFYVITNTASWLFNPFHNPEYTKDLAGFIRALTLGIPGHPTTLEFFRNTLMSGGLFTGIFAGAMKLSEAAESKKEKETEEEPAEEAEGDEVPGESKA